MKGIRKRVFALATCFAMAITLVPAFKAGAEDVNKQSTNVEAQSTVQTVEQRKFVAYFTEWAYKNEQNHYYTVDMMPWDKMTHVNYAFAHVDPKTNKIALGDKAAATELTFPGQTNDFPYKGHFNVLNSYKKKYPNVKTLISVGGWAESTGFYTMCSTAEGRETFANSCVDFARQYGFDGIDIDYEYPTALEDAGNPIDFELAKPYRKDAYKNYVEMLKVLRQKLDEASIKDGKQYLTTAAVTASAWVVSGMGEENFTKYLDFINLMTYDLHGSWNGFVAHNAPLYSDPDDSEIKFWKLPYNYLSTDWAVKYYSGFMDPSKIVIGVPYYTRGWKNVKPGSKPGGLYGEAPAPGKKIEEAGDGAVGIDNIWHDKLPDGTEEPGGSNPIWHVKNLLADKSLGYVRYWDDVSKVPYVWNESKKVFLTYEDEQSMAEKVDYTIKNNLGGIMVWEIDGDFKQDSTGKYVVGDSLTKIAADKFKAAGPILVDEQKPTMPLLDYDIQLVNGYDHPYNEYKVNLINNTGKAITKPAKIEFDLPNSFALKDAPWSSGANIKVEDKGLYKHFTVTVDEWGVGLGTGTTTLFQGEMILRPMGGAKNMVLNGNQSKPEWDRRKPPAPSILGAVVSSSTTDSRDGNYTLTVNVPANSKGTSFDLYEGDKVIKTQAITGTSAQTFTYDMKSKPNGTYTYKVVTKNATSSVQSSVVSVYVGPEIAIKPALVSSSVFTSTNGSYDIKVSVPENSQGTTLEVYEGTTKIATETITNVAKDFTYSMKDKKNGTYSYSAIVKNAAKSVDSNVVNVKVAIKLSYAAYDPNKDYTMNDMVSYKGKIYKSKAWWVKGQAPDLYPNIWEYVGEDVQEPDVVDLAGVALRYNAKKGDANYDELYDRTNDGFIDIYDLVNVASQMK
ncbi:MAG: glycosyl hydrolase family 18 protein [Clostridium sp.]